MVTGTDSRIACRFDRHGRWPGVIGAETGNGDCDQAIVDGGPNHTESGERDLQSVGGNDKAAEG